MTHPSLEQIERALTLDPVHNIEALESVMLEQEQLDILTREHFINGMYGREIVIPAGAMLTGRVYKDGYLDIMLSGDMSVATPQGAKRITGVNIMEAPPGRKRAGYAHTDTHWITVHRTDQLDPGDMLDQLTFFSRDEYRRHVQVRDSESYQSVLEAVGMSEDQVQAQVQDESDQVTMPPGYANVFQVAPSDLHGLGIMALEPKEIGEHIGPSRVGGMRTPLGRYTNHSAYPNAVMQPLDNGDVAMVACRAIQPGDEITVHYAVTINAMQEELCRE